MMIIRRMLRSLSTHKTTLLVGSFLFLLSSSAQSRDVLLDRIAAIVNNDVIMLSEVKNAAIKTKIAGNTALSDQSLIQLELDRLILDKVQVQRAKAIGINVDNPTLNDAMRSIAKQNNLGLEQFRVALIKEGLDYKDFRETIRNKLYIDILKRRQQNSNKKITESEIDDLIKAQSYRLNKDVQYHLLDVFISAPNGVSVSQFNQMHKRAFSLRKKLLLNPTTISQKLIKSVGASSSDLGWKQTKSLSPAYVRTLSLMGIGELSPVVRDARGFHILKLLDQRGGLRKITQQARVRHILIATDKKNARLKATQLRQKLLAGENFAKLAKAHSADPSSAREGGEMNMTDPNSFVPPFANAVKTLPLNTLSQPIQTRFGWHILEVLERRNSDQTRETLKSQAEKALTEKNSSEKYKNWLQGIRDEAYVDIRL